jgi:hypothetical protein
LFILSEAFNILSSLVPLEEKHTAELGVGSEVYVPKGALKGQPVEYDWANFAKDWHLKERM